MSEEIDRLLQEMNAPKEECVRPEKLEKARARVERALARRKDARDAYRAEQERTAEE